MEELNGKAHLIPAPTALTPLERLAASVCLAAAALLVSTACGYNGSSGNVYFNTHYADSKPQTLPPMPAAPGSARVLPPLAFRVGMGGDGVLLGSYQDASSGGKSSGIRVADTSLAQGNMQASLGLPLDGLEADLGLGVPNGQPYLFGRYQLLGRAAASGTMLTLEAGGAAYYDFFGGLELGNSPTPDLDFEADLRSGSDQGDPYIEAGAGTLLRLTGWTDLNGSLSYRAYGSSQRPSILRGGLGVAFGPDLADRALLRQYQDDALALLKAGYPDLALQAAKKNVSMRSHDPLAWKVLSQIYLVQGNKKKARWAYARAKRLGLEAEDSTAPFSPPLPPQKYSSP